MDWNPAKTNMSFFWKLRFRRPAWRRMNLGCWSFHLAMAEGSSELNVFILFQRICFTKLGNKSKKKASKIWFNGSFSRSLVFKMPVSFTLTSPHSKFEQLSTAVLSGSIAVIALWGHPKIARLRCDGTRDVLEKETRRDREFEWQIQNATKPFKFSLPVYQQENFLTFNWSTLNDVLMWVGGVFRNSLRAWAQRQHRHPQNVRKSTSNSIRGQRKLHKLNHALL